MNVTHRSPIRLRFGLRTLLAVMVMFALVAAMVGWEVRTRSIAAKLVSRGAQVGTKRSPWTGVLKIDYVGLFPDPDTWKSKRAASSRSKYEYEVIDWLGKQASAGPPIVDEDIRLVAQCSDAQIVSLEYLNISDQALSHLRDLHKLTMLDLAGTEITNEGLANLKTLANLNCLRLDDTQCSGEGLRQMRTSRLSALYLGGTRVSDDDVEVILKMGPIEYLYLYNTDITDKGAALLSQIKTLKHISLRKTKITDACIPELCTLPDLQVLKLDWTEISDVGLVEASTIPKLDWLTVCNTQVTTEGVESIRRARPGLLIQYPKPSGNIP